MQSRAEIKSNVEFHEQKASTMFGELTVLMLLRGIAGRTGLTRSGKPYQHCLADALMQLNLIKGGEHVLMVGDGLGYGMQGLTEEYTGPVN